MALQMCLERMEPCPEDVEKTERRQAWCDQVSSVKVPVEETISKSSSGDNARVGEKTELILTQCRYDILLFCSNFNSPTGQSSNHDFLIHIRINQLTYQLRTGFLTITWPKLPNHRVVVRVNVL